MRVQRRARRRPPRSGGGRSRRASTHLTITPADLDRAVAWIRRGGIVAYPTETFYGLGVDPAQPAAVDALFDLKGRDLTSAIPLLAAARGDVERWCGPLDAASGRLAEAFWPGPLALVLAAPAGIAPRVHAGTGTVAVRVPGHPAARALAAAAGVLLTATSANRSGEAAAARAEDLAGLARDSRVLVLDGGPTPGGAPSTIVDARTSPVRLVREGAVPWNRVLRSMHG
jgi:L-threonylcarbamoyladenylate synthase